MRFHTRAGREERHDTQTQFRGISSISTHWRWYLPIPFHSQFFCTARRPAQPLSVLLKLSGRRGIVKDFQRQRSSAFSMNGLVAHHHCRPVIRMWAIHLTTSQQELPEVQFRHHRTGLAQWLAIVEILNSECQAAVHIPSWKPNDDEFGAKAKRKQRHTLVDVKHKLSLSLSLRAWVSPMLVTNKYRYYIPLAPWLVRWLVCWNSGVVVAGTTSLCDEAMLTALTGLQSHSRTV